MRGAARAIRRLVEFNKAHPELVRALREGIEFAPSEVRSDRS